MTCVYDFGNGFWIDHDTQPRYRDGRIITKHEVIRLVDGQSGEKHDSFSKLVAKITVLVEAHCLGIRMSYHIWHLKDPQSLTLLLLLLDERN
jgi:hypothetical protein